MGTKVLRFFYEPRFVTVVTALVCRLFAVSLLVQDNEWLIGCRYLSLESLIPVLKEQTEVDIEILAYDEAV